MPRTPLVLHLLFIALSGRTMPQDASDNRHLIDQLKKTPLSQIEAGLPQKTFASWFADLVKPNPVPIEYEVKECVDDKLPGVESQQPVTCVVAYTQPQKPNWPRWIEMRFVVIAAPGPAKPGDRETVKPLLPRLVSACEGPSNPMMKRPTRCFSKLSDLEKLVQGSRAQ